MSLGSERLGALPPDATMRSLCLSYPRYANPLNKRHRPRPRKLLSAYATAISAYWDQPCARGGATTTIRTTSGASNPRSAPSSGRNRRACYPLCRQGRRPGGLRTGQAGSRRHSPGHRDGQLTPFDKPPPLGMAAEGHEVGASGPCILKTALSAMILAKKGLDGGKIQEIDWRHN